MKHIVNKVTTSVKDLAKRYGRIGLAVYLSVSALSLTSCYIAVKSGLDTRTIMDKMGIKLSEHQERFGVLIGAYAVHKLLLPVRLSATVFLTGLFSRMGKKKLQ